jgi:hypothetical protein
MKMILENVTVAKGCAWITKMDDEKRRFFGNSKIENGSINLVSLQNGTFAPTTGELIFDTSQFQFLVSSPCENLLIIDESGVQALSPCVVDQTSPSNASKSDDGFKALVKKLLSGEAQLAALQLLDAIREREPRGELKRGERNNFSETPDNFWYVIVQPRKNNLSITVRGKVQDFPVTGLDLADDRGNSKFFFDNREQISDALEIIFSAKRN